jgi:hypothetical protein
MQNKSGYNRQIAGSPAKRNVKMHSGEQLAMSSHKLFKAGKCGKLQYDVVSQLTKKRVT